MFVHIMYKHHTMTIVIIATSEDETFLDTYSAVVLMTNCCWHTIGLQSRHFIPSEVDVVAHTVVAGAGGGIVVIVV